MTQPAEAQHTKTIYAGRFVADIEEISEGGRIIKIDIKKIRLAGMPDRLENRVAQIPPQIVDELDRMYRAQHPSINYLYQRKSI